MSLFLSTLSLRRATSRVRGYSQFLLGFLSTLSLRRATGYHYDNYNLHCVISIHALLTESDTRFWTIHWAQHTISIHALLTESDCSGSQQPEGTTNFYPRSPYGERPGYQRPCERPTTISIHALLTESDNGHGSALYKVQDFYPRSPYGERQVGQKRLRQKLAISIHALLTESDGNLFNGRFRAIQFLSTLSLRRATAVTTLEGGSDRDFYPRSPYGERHTL